MTPRLRARVSHLLKTILEKNIRLSPTLFALNNEIFLARQVDIPNMVHTSPSVNITTQEPQSSASLAGSSAVRRGTRAGRRRDASAGSPALEQIEAARRREVLPRSARGSEPLRFRCHFRCRAAADFFFLFLSLQRQNPNIFLL